MSKKREFLDPNHQRQQEIPSTSAPRRPGCGSAEGLTCKAAEYSNNQRPYPPHYCKAISISPQKKNWLEIESLSFQNHWSFGTVFPKKGEEKSTKVNKPKLSREVKEGPVRHMESAFQPATRASTPAANGGPFLVFGGLRKPYTRFFYWLTGCLTWVQQNEHSCSNPPFFLLEQLFLLSHENHFQEALTAGGSCIPKKVHV